MVNIANKPFLFFILILISFYFTGWIYYDVFSSNDKQKWKVIRKSSVENSKIAFENVNWPGYYLTGNDRSLCTWCGYTWKIWWTAHKMPIMSL